MHLRNLGHSSTDVCNEIMTCAVGSSTDEGGGANACEGKRGGSLMKMFSNCISYLWCPCGADAQQHMYIQCKCGGMNERINYGYIN